eukprot:scaffold141986_cov29-Tisochrysis_lutea.AAC.6
MPGVLLHKGLVATMISCRGQSVGIDALRFMQPQLHKLERVCKLFGLREQHALEYGGEMR